MLPIFLLFLWNIFHLLFVRIESVLWGFPISSSASFIINEVAYGRGMENNRLKMYSTSAELAPSSSCANTMLSNIMEPNTTGFASPGSASGLSVRTDSLPSFSYDIKSSNMLKSKQIYHIEHCSFAKSKVTICGANWRHWWMQILQNFLYRLHTTIYFELNLNCVL